MKHLKKSLALLVLLTTIIGSPIYAQFSFNWDGTLKPAVDPGILEERAKAVMQDNEYVSTGCESGFFYANPLMLDGQPLDYATFGFGSKGELTVIKGAAITGKTILVPFIVYLRRDGNKVEMPGKEKCNSATTKIELSEILKFGEPGDQLVIEPVRKEDGPAKRILKLLGC